MNVVTSSIRNAKRDCYYKKLGNNPSSKTLYRKLKYQMAEDESKNRIPDIKLNENFTSIAQIVSYKVPDYDNPVNVPNNEKTMVPNYSDENEVAQTRNRKKPSVGHDGLSNKMLKQGSPVIEKYLSEAFKNSIMAESFQIS